jgi:predicted PurR-regulated permease PerM
MASSSDTSRPARTFTLVTTVVAVGVLYFAKEVLVPFALAVLLSFLLAPLVSRLEHRRLGRVASVSIVVTAAFLVISGVLWLMIDEAIDVADNLADYQDNIVQKIDALRTETGVIGRLRDRFTQFNERMADPHKERGGEQPARISPPGEGNQPLPVEIIAATSPWAAVSTWLPAIGGLLANAGVVILFTVFMLIEREDLRNRLIRLIGPGQISVTTQAMDDATRRVAKYLRAQLVVNGSYGLAVAIGLFVIGIPNAPLWGLLAGILRYIPYAGPAFAAACPIALATASFDNWSPPLLTLGLFVVLELISNNVIEPMLYRSSTGISTIGILVAAVFWTWLWGAVGLVLSTPLTVCIAVMGRYVPQLSFLNTLLSDEPVLSPGAHYYQRLLAGDQDEADSLVDKQLAGGTIEDVYAGVLMPALVLTEQDHHRGNIDPQKYAFVIECIRETVEDLPDRIALAERVAHPAAAASADKEAAAAEPTPAHESAPFSERSVICVPARDEADEIAAIMLTQLLVLKGFSAQFLSVKALASESLDQVAESQAGVVCVSAVPPFALNHSRYLCKRMRGRFPNLKLVIGLWLLRGVDKNTEDRLRGAGADKIVTSLQQALAEI